MLVEAKEAKKLAKKAKELEQIALDDTIQDTIQQWINKINRIIKYHAGRGRTQTVYDTGETYIRNEVIASIINILEDAGYRVKAYHDYGVVCFSINWE